MYQSYDDMLEDEYLRKRIRSILKGQVKARGYGNSWNAELGPRNYRVGAETQKGQSFSAYPDDSSSDDQRGGVCVGGVSVGGALSDYSLKELKGFIRSHNSRVPNRNKIKKYTKLDKQQLLVKLKKINFSVNVNKSKNKVKQPQVRKTTGSAWIKFMQCNAGHGYSLKELSTMYRKKNKGGVLIQKKGSRSYSRGVMTTKPSQAEPTEGGEYMGGIYLR